MDCSWAACKTIDLTGTETRVLHIFALSPNETIERSRLIILSHFDPDLNIEEDKYYPVGNKNDLSYRFWLDLEHGYCETASSRIHLYADDERWAVVGEKSGYQNRGLRAEIELYYFGNCIDYPISSYPERKYISNVSHFSSVYADDHHPGQEELYQLIAKILVTKDTTLWKPTLPANNHWSNWESGNL